MVSISLNQRRRWVSVAAHVAKTMINLASNVDEREINAQLDKLEMLVSEASANTKNKESKTI